MYLGQGPQGRLTRIPCGLSRGSLLGVGATARMVYTHSWQAVLALAGNLAGLRAGRPSFPPLELLGPPVPGRLALSHSMVAGLWGGDPEGHSDCCIALRGLPRRSQSIASAVLCWLAQFGPGSQGETQTFSRSMGGVSKISRHVLTPPVRGVGSGQGRMVRAAGSAVRGERKEPQGAKPGQSQRTPRV